MCNPGVCATAHGGAPRFSEALPRSMVLDGLDSAPEGAGVLPVALAPMRRARGSAWPPRLELTDRAIEAVRVRTSHDAGAGPEGSPPLGGSCRQRHAGNRPPATGCRVLSRLGRDGAGGCHRPRPPAATPPDEA